jgi:hypothetical protein
MRSVEGDMLVLGKPSELTPWQETARHQRRSARLAPRVSARPGVYFFSSHQEADTWNLQKQIAASLKRKT